MTDVHYFYQVKFLWMKGIRQVNENGKEIANPIEFQAFRDEAEMFA